MQCNEADNNSTTSIKTCVASQTVQTVALEQAEHPAEHAMHT